MDKEQRSQERQQAVHGVEIPTGLVILVGPPGAGKTTFTEELASQGKIDGGAALSSDAICLEMFGTTDDRESKDPEVFAELDRRITERLASGKPAIVDATNVRKEARARLIGFAQQTGVPVTALKFTSDVATLIAQNAERDRNEDEAMVREYAKTMRNTASDEELHLEGVDCVFAVPGRQEGVDAAGAASRFSFITVGDRE
jgi:predicted kinase